MTTSQIFTVGDVYDRLTAIRFKALSLEAAILGTDKAGREEEDALNALLEVSGGVVDELKSLLDEIHAKLLHPVKAAA